ncbi:aldo/keto reductase [Butyrivibrio sp. MC2013]|uniref:aldo/keto reductase n=1 Tax=Butyrivibrio sp. MC2013 TaxID=1280686 RepID=UPI00041B8330|nr:aldo/keto reductase [Butyrivibrio sp. MC2013]
MDFKPAKKLGFGLMRLPLNEGATDAADVDVEQVSKMVDIFLEKGFTYFDTAWMYNAFHSEDVVKEALTSRHPRESYTLATKLHAGFINSKEDRDKVFNTQLEKTGAGYFDYYLIHGIEESMIDKYEELDCFNWLLDKKEKGLVRHAGFSYHDTPELLDEILTRHPEMEFVQLQINYLDWESEWIQSRGCYEVACKHGKPVIVMEPVKGGTLANLPDEAAKLFKEHDSAMSLPSWAVRFAASLDNVMVVLSGMSSIAQMEDNTSYMQDFVPLTKDETDMCFKAGEIINNQIAIPCTGCSYCTEGCPMKIAIPRYFSLYNENMRENMAQKGWTINFTNYGNLVAAGAGRASDCIACGQCESVCPQHLPIIENLKLVAGHFEG